MMTGMPLRRFAEDVIDTYVQMGNSALAKGEYQIAYKMYKAAFDEPSSKLQKGKFMGHLLVNMGRTHEGLKQLYKAKLFYIRALAHHRKNGPGEELYAAEVLARLARITAQQGLYRQAADFAEQSFEAYRHDGNGPTKDLIENVLQLEKMLIDKSRRQELNRLAPFIAGLQAPDTMASVVPVPAVPITTGR